MSKRKVIIKKDNIDMGFVRRFMSLYFTTKGQILLVLTILLIGVLLSFTLGKSNPRIEEDLPSSQGSYWFLLHRKSNVEYLYSGSPGKKDESTLIRTFHVKTGVSGEQPTPLPQFIGREYWLITQEFEINDNPEIAPYFLKLDIPYSDEYPFGPQPYFECNGQCDWKIPGSFGLHGVNGDISKLSSDDPGSSGCIRHRDEDITYLYNILDPNAYEIRYYVENI